MDITGLMPGERARCPYTGRIFTIPNIGEAFDSNETKDKKIVDTAIASISDNIEFKVIESKNEDEIQASADNDKSIVPYARWSKRVGYVISPYGGQLIDVQGKTSGSVLRCPFSGNFADAKNQNFSLIFYVFLVDSVRASRDRKECKI